MDAPAQAGLPPTLATFTEFLGDRFRIGMEGERPLEVELIEARGLLPASANPARRESFSLIFLGPPRPLLPQRIYAFEHDVMGRLEIFIVPVARDDRGARYEAIFN